MADQEVIKGVFDEDGAVASIVKRETSARIMVKGAEPDGDNFITTLTKIMGACRSHVDGLNRVEMTAVLVANPGAAESAEISPAQVKEMGLSELAFMDAECGITIRVIDADTNPTPLAYANLAADGAFGDQPGLVDIPGEFPRKAYRDLNENEQKIYGAAAQVAGEGLLKLVCIEDQELRLIAGLRDMGLAKARSAMVPLSELAKELAEGKPLKDVAAKLDAMHA